MIPEGYVVAFKDSPQVHKDWAKVDGLLCDGVNDGEQFHRAHDLAAGTRQKRILLAPGNALDMRWQPTGKVWPSHAVLRPRMGTLDAPIVVSTFPGLEGWTVLHASWSPSAFEVQGGTRNELVDFPVGPGWLTWRGFNIDGHAALMPGGKSRLDSRYDFEGVRSWGTPGLRLENLHIWNIRGTTGAGGIHETTGITLYQGKAIDCVVEQLDGGPAATGLHQMFGDGQFINCRVEGNGRMAHGSAQWRAKGAVRWGVKARGCTSSGVRSELSVDSIDVDIDVEDNQHGFISQCTTNHQVYALRSVRNREWGIGLLTPTRFKLHSQKGVFGNGTDLMLYSRDACPGGEPTPRISADLSPLRGYLWNKAQNPQVVPWSEVGL